MTPADEPSLDDAIRQALEERSSLVAAVVRETERLCAAVGEAPEARQLPTSSDEAPEARQLPASSGDGPAALSRQAGGGELAGFIS